MRYIFYILISTIFICNLLLHGSAQQIQRGLKVFSRLAPKKIKPGDFTKVKKQINIVYTGETPVSEVPFSESMPIKKKPTVRETATEKSVEPLPEKKVTLPKKSTSKTVTRRRKFTAIQQIGHEATENLFEIKKLENEQGENFRYITEITEKTDDVENARATIKSALTNKEIIKEFSKLTEKPRSEIVKMLKDHLQQKIPEPEVANELASKTVDIIQNDIELKKTVEQEISSQVELAAQIILPLVQKPSESLQTTEGKAPFETTGSTELSLSTGIDLLANPEKRAELAKVPFESNKSVKNVIEQQSKELQISPVDITVPAMQEIFSGNISAETSAIINESGYVETFLTGESINYLSQTVGPKIQEIFAKDSEFLAQNSQTNGIDIISKTDSAGNTTIIADGLKPLQTMPENTKPIIEEIVKIETKHALAKLPTLETQLVNAFSKKHDPVITEAKKQVDEASEKLSLKPEGIPAEEFSVGELKEPITGTGSKKALQPAQEIGAPSEKSEPPEKKLPGPEEIPTEEFPVAETKEPQKGIATKPEIPPTSEQVAKTVTESPGTKQLPTPEQTPKTKPTPGEQKQTFEQISEPRAQEPTRAEKPKSIAEMVKGKAKQIQETKPLEGVTKTPISPTPLTAATETLMIGIGKAPILISPGAKPIETQAETLPLEVIRKTGVEPQELQTSPLKTELTRVEKEGQRVTAPFVSEATLITTPELKVPSLEPLRPKTPSGTVEETKGPKVITETPEKRLSATDSQIESFVHESSKVIENFSDISDVFLEKTNLDLQQVAPQAEKNIGDLIKQGIETSQAQLKDGQSTLHKALNESKNQESTEIINSRIQNSVVQTKNMLNRTNETIKTGLDTIVDPAVKQLAKDAVDLITRSAQKSLTSMDVLARISAELTNINNGNFKNTTELTERLQGLKTELETEIKEQQKQANELSQMHIREKRTKQGAAKKSTLLRTILKALVGIIAAIAIEEFDSKQIAELSQQIADTQALIEATEKPPKISGIERKKTEKQRFLPITNQSTQLKNRTISAALQTPEQLKAPTPVSYEIHSEIMPEREFVSEKIEEPLPTFFGASRETIAFQNEQDSKLLGEQLHLIEKKVEKRLEKSEKRASRERKKMEEQTISDYKNMYTSSDQQSVQPPVSKEESVTPAASDTGRPYTPSYGYEPSFDHSYDMFDFSGLSTDFENFDLGYFGDLDFLSEFGFEDWESFGREYPDTFPPTTPKTTEQYPEKTSTQPEESYPGALLPYDREKPEIIGQEEKVLPDGTKIKEPGPEEQETQAPRVIRTPYTQYLAPALAIITIGCAFLFYWFM